MAADRLPVSRVFGILAGRRDGQLVRLAPPCGQATGKANAYDRYPKHL